MRWMFVFLLVGVFLVGGVCAIGGEVVDEDVSLWDRFVGFVKDFRLTGFVVDEGMEFGAMADGVSYYVSYTDGNDANCTGLSSTAYPGTGSGIDCPYQNLAKLDSGLANGDTILLKRGDTWNGTRGLRIKYNLTVGAYGNGDKPHIKTTNADGYGAIYGYVSNLSGVVVENIRITGPMTFNNIGSNITIRNIDVLSSNVNGILLQKIDGYLIEGCVVNNASSGIVIYGSATDKITNGTIQNCTIGPFINGDDITLHSDGSGNTIGNTHYILNNTLLGANENCIDTAVGEVGIRPSGLIVRNNTCTNASSYGMGAGMDDILFENNFIYNSGEEGFYLGHANNTTIRYNLVTNPGKEAVAMTSGVIRNTVNNYIYGNTFIGGSATSRSIIRIYSGGGNNVGFDLKNNIISEEINKFIEFASAATPNNTLSVFDNNLYYDSGGYLDRWMINGTLYDSLSEWKVALGGLGLGNDNTAQSTDPLLLNSSGDMNTSINFQLQYNSPAIDAGTNVNLTTDYAGNPIYGTPDIGAYEYQPPHNISVDLVEYNGTVRIYSDGKYRYKNRSSGFDVGNKSFSLLPNSGYAAHTSTQTRNSSYDVELISWTTSLMSFNVTNMSASGAVNLTVCNLTASRDYTLDIDSVRNDTLTSNASGCVSFQYSGTWSEHEFELGIVALSSTTTDAGGSGGGGSGVPTYFVDGLGEEGLTRVLLEGYELDFSVGGEDHLLRVDLVGEDKVVVTVSSDPQTRELRVGEEWRVDLDLDSVYDLLVRVDSILLGKVEIFVGEISEGYEDEGVGSKVEGVKEEGVVGEVVDVVVEEVRERGVWWVGVVVVLGLVGWFWWKGKTKEK
ncbi:hypothetical protein HNV12_03440 [Methanococcoides sp. SA1]|nr:hypothetical protein [Methanococcoides sp. SA1]